MISTNQDRGWRSDLWKLLLLLPLLPRRGRRTRGEHQQHQQHQQHLLATACDCLHQALRGKRDWTDCCEASCSFFLFWSSVVLMRVSVVAAEGHGELSCRLGMSTRRCPLQWDVPPTHFPPNSTLMVSWTPEMDFYFHLPTTALACIIVSWPKSRLSIPLHRRKEEVTGDG
ncbi:hypothetical protein B0T20DRAFT_70180 [Sordaria brevicollis]|uniref:Uncharacterized protein n=1 Tax=Sordaria brevicollis TaxID=83679 RepID=A0AAE0U631_SORBR|nr:hypothetical protein B0T20DRAFT_70180 [Sordaria brevicollis]